MKWNDYRIIMNNMLKKYKVEFLETSRFMVDVYADSVDSAMVLARKGFDEGIYQDVGDNETYVGEVYDVTNTEDPFYPINE